jgi:hypothetical protein
MQTNSNIAVIVILVAVVAAVVVLMFVTGWADDRAPAGSAGRGGTVSVTGTGGAP